MVPPGGLPVTSAKSPLYARKRFFAYLGGATYWAHAKVSPQYETSQKGGKISDLSLIIPHRFARSPVYLTVMLLYHLGQIMVNGKG
jgi:hypothetical protein